MKLKKGDSAANFSLNNQDGVEISLAQYLGKKVVLYFYPKDLTSGCTTEAVDFTQLQSQFMDSNTVVLGVSKDSISSHLKFCQKKELTIDLLSDEEGEVCEAYGVWQEKKNYGKTYMGIVRSTFLIDENGIIEAIWSPVRVKDHAQTVLNAL